MASSSLEWLPAGELSISDVPGGGNPQPRYPLAATLGNEIGEIGVKSVTPTRRGAAQDPSSDPAPSRAGRGHKHFYGGVIFPIRQDFILAHELQLELLETGKPQAFSDLLIAAIVINRDEELIT